MGTLRFADIQSRPIEAPDLTSLTIEEFRALVRLFETVFQAHMAEWRLDGRPRTARRYTTYKNCPLPTPGDRLLFVLVYLKTYPLQVVQGWLSQGRPRQSATACIQRRTAASPKRARARALL